MKKSAENSHAHLSIRHKINPENAFNSSNNTPVITIALKIRKTHIKDVFIVQLNAEN